MTVLKLVPLTNPMLRHPHNGVILTFLSEETTVEKFHSISLPHFARGYTGHKDDANRPLESPSAALFNYARNLNEIAGLMALDGF